MPSSRKRVRTRPTLPTRVQSARAATGETHEPSQPENWPDGHVSVDLTGDEAGECIKVTIHGVEHYLHSTTAYELRNMLVQRVDEWQIMAKGEGFGLEDYKRLE